MIQELSLDEAARRIVSYKSPSTVSSLYEFGKLLFSEGIARTSQLESKATIVVGYCGAILAFLLSRSTPYSRALLWGYEPLVIFLAAASAFLALLFGFWAGRIHKWRWIGEKIWLPQALPREHPEETLDLHYLESLYEIHQELKRANRRKGNLVHLAQWLLVIALVFLSAALFAEWWERLPK